MAKFNLPLIAAGVPEELAARLNRIARALRLSFFEYELVDIVLDYALVTAELGYRLRFKAQTGFESKKAPRYVDLIEWAETESLLVGVEEKAHLLRNVRNGNVHPNHDSFGGLAFIPLFRYVIEVVNCLFRMGLQTSMESA